jgi:ring-1,2-phenylacetyl-CoA epoxidase subunit PaaD
VVIMTGTPEVTQLRALLGALPDPELPMLTLADLGILREVAVEENGQVTVVLTPTYVGCPAIETIREEVQRTLHEHGCLDATVRLALSPPWTTDWISENGRRVLAAHGVAPPGPVGPVGEGSSAVPLDLTVRCPRCGSTATRVVSRFGPTPCTALRTCRSCLEPFEHVKAI